MNEMDQKAKLGVLRELRKAAMDDMGGGMAEGLKKVTVAAPDTQHLKQGLDKAHQMVDDMPKDLTDLHDDDNSAEESAESPEQEMAEIGQEPPGDQYECKTPEEVDAKIMDLLKQKQEMLAARGK